MKILLNFQITRSLVGILAFGLPMLVPSVAWGDIPAPPIRIGKWVTDSRPEQKHELLLLGLVRSKNVETPPFIHWLGRQERRWRGRLRVVAVSVLEDDADEAAKRLKSLNPTIPVGLDSLAKISDRAGLTARGWLATAPNLGSPSVFLVGKDGAIKWYGGFTDGDVPIDAFVEGKWEKSAASRKFWQAKRSRELALRDWRQNPARQQIDAVDKLISQQKWAEALDETRSLERLPRTDWLDPKKFAPALRLSIYEHKRDVAGFYHEARRIASLHEQDAPLLNLVAWKIVDPHSHIPNRDWALAATLARQATKLAPTVAGFRDTLAWALYGQKVTRDAVKSERIALRYCEDEDELQKCQAALSLFTKFPR